MYVKYIVIQKFIILLFGWESLFMNFLFGFNQKVYDINGAIVQVRELRFYQGPNLNERLNYMIENYV